MQTALASGTIDWRTITALNIASTLAQIGQYGMVFVMLPLWLAQHGNNALQTGMFEATLWAGMLPGLALAPPLSAR